MVENKGSRFMVTLDQFESLVQVTPEELTNAFNSLSSKFAFQLEVGDETKRPHYQCVISLNDRTRAGTLTSKLTQLLRVERTQITTIMQSGTWEEGVAYCTKPSTRVKGPWLVGHLLYSENDIKFLDEKEKRFPWQQDIYDSLFEDNDFTWKEADTREITWVVDPVGCSGKSTFSKWLFVRQKSLVAKVAFGTASQLRSAIVNAGPKRLYIIDIPRTLGEDDHLNNIITNIEDLKGGFCTSSFYGKSQELLLDPPHVIIFSNKLPNLNLLSGDRWRILTVSEGQLSQLGVS